MNDVAFIYFDAAGTLLFPQPSVGDIYAAVGQRHGSRRAAAELSARFRAAFQLQEAHDAANEWRTSDERELARWRAIVGETIDDATDPEECFTALYHHFAQPDAWICPPDIADVLRELDARGYGLGIASNFDHRLSGIIAGKPELALIRQVQISAQAQRGKPAPPFFAAAAALAQMQPSSILFVGDDLRNDYDGPRAAGFTALLLDARDCCPRPDVRHIAALSELLQLCPPRR
jgi:putative hydrolase of the HAD superfamily